MQNFAFSYIFNLIYLTNKFLFDVWTFQKKYDSWLKKSFRPKKIFLEKIFLGLLISFFIKVCWKRFLKNFVIFGKNYFHYLFKQTFVCICSKFEDEHMSEKKDCQFLHFFIFRFSNRTCLQLSNEPLFAEMGGVKFWALMWNILATKALFAFQSLTK